jgi:hypothetical protein
MILATGQEKLERKLTPFQNFSFQGKDGVPDGYLILNLQADGVRIQCWEANSYIHIDRSLRRSLQMLDSESLHIGDQYRRLSSTNAVEADPSICCVLQLIVLKNPVCEVACRRGRPATGAERRRLGSGPLGACGKYHASFLHQCHPQKEI